MSIAKKLHSVIAHIEANNMQNAQDTLTLLIAGVALADDGELSEELIDEFIELSPEDLEEVVNAPMENLTQEYKKKIDENIKDYSKEKQVDPEVVRRKLVDNAIFKQQFNDIIQKNKDARNKIPESITKLDSIEDFIAIDKAREDLWEDALQLPEEEIKEPEAKKLQQNVKKMMFKLQDLLKADANYVESAEPKLAAFPAMLGKAVQMAKSGKLSSLQLLQLAAVINETFGKSSDLAKAFKPVYVELFEESIRNMANPESMKKLTNIQKSL